MRRPDSVLVAVAEALVLPHHRDGRAGRRPAAHPAEGPDRLGRAHPVGGQADVALELGERVRRLGSEDAVDPSGVEPQAAEEPLELGDVVTAHVR